MSTDRDVTRIVRSWLEEGVTALPDRVLDAVLDQVPATRQRRAWWPARRVPHMKASIKILVAAAAVVVIALIGINLVPRSGVGGPGSTPVPTATPAPTPSPTPAPTLPPSGTARARDVPIRTSAAGHTSRSRCRPAGTRIRTSSASPTRTHPTAWSSTRGRTSPRSTTTRATGGRCAVSVGPTVDAVVDCARGAEAGTTVTPVDITIDGFHGKEIDLMVPLTVTFDAPSGASQCDGGLYTAWTLPTGKATDTTRAPASTTCSTSSTSTARRSAIKRSFYEVNTAADRAELQAIIDSIKITP